METGENAAISAFSCGIEPDVHGKGAEKGESSGSCLQPKGDRSADLFERAYF